MKFKNERPASDAEWYFRKDPESDRFYEIFSPFAESIRSVGPVQMKKSGSLWKGLLGLPMNMGRHSV